MKKLNEKKIEEIIKLRLKDFTYNEIKNQINCAKGTISKYCIDNGISDGFGKKQQTITSDDIDKIRMLCEFLTVQQVCKLTGIGRTTVKKYKLKRNTYKVYQFDLNNNLIKIWVDTAEIVSSTPYNKSTIKNACNPNIKTHIAYNFKWLYEHDIKNIK